MEELIAKANQAILEARWLQQQGRSLRLEAALLANRLGETVAQSRAVAKDFFDLQTSLDRSLFGP